MAKLRQRTGGYSRVAHAQYAAADELPKPGRAYPQQFPQRPQGPSVGDFGAHAQCAHPEADGADGAAEALSNLVDRLISRPIQQFFIVSWTPAPVVRSRNGAKSVELCWSVARWTILKSSKFGILSQPPDTLPAVSSRPFWNKL